MPPLSDDYSKALDYAYLLLSYRKRTAKEIFSRLILKNYSDNIADIVVRDLQDSGYINDKKFAVWWIDFRCRERPKGKIALKSELLSKGIEIDIIESALHEMPYDEVELAWKACQSALSSYRLLSTKTAQRRLAALLSGRGFSVETVEVVIDKFFETT